MFVLAVATRSLNWRQNACKKPLYVLNTPAFATLPTARAVEEPRWTVDPQLARSERWSTLDERGGAELGGIEES